MNQLKMYDGVQDVFTQWNLVLGIEWHKENVNP